MRCRWRDFRRHESPSWLRLELSHGQIRMRKSVKECLLAQSYLKTMSPRMWRHMRRVSTWRWEVLLDLDGVGLDWSWSGVSKGGRELNAELELLVLL